ncbi:MAG: hypothetical protein ACC707_01715 [Thiohalomonadales bacterium]
MFIEKNKAELANRDEYRESMETNRGRLLREPNIAYRADIVGEMASLKRNNTVILE